MSPQDKKKRQHKNEEVAEHTQTEFAGEFGGMNAAKLVEQFQMSKKRKNKRDKQ